MKSLAPHKFIAAFHVALFSFSITPSPAGSAVTINYGYDELNRLTSLVRTDGPTMAYQYDLVGNITNRAINSIDSDNDLLKDIEEITYGLNPNSSDSDADGLSDYFEVCFDGDCTNYNPYDPISNPNGTDLNASKSDSDGDGIPDDIELLADTNPLNSADFPVIADGDLNIDGIVNAVDVLLIIKIVRSPNLPTAIQLQHGDVAPLINGIPQPDGILNAGDILIIQRKALGQIDF